ncbi:MAG: bacterial Ig-like domain-containing protein [Acetobacter sp.]|nr:bacterial Ig-like domain-containing protein [Acetobacter sp.]
MSVKCILTEQGGKGGGGTSIVLQKIEVTTQPTKTSYYADDSFNKAGMVVTASYGLANSAAVITTADVTGSCTITPDPLTDGTTKVTISYSENGVTQTTTCNITVSPKLRSIAATAPTTEYEYGGTFPANYNVTATYSNGTTKTVSATCSNRNLNAVGSHTITLSYTDTGVTKTTTITIDVKRKKVAKPALKSAYSSYVGKYTGGVYNINSSTYLDNYSDTYYTATGNTQTNANGSGAAYTMTCKLTANYRWSDGTTTDVTISWKIEQADRTISGLSDIVISGGSSLTQTLTPSVSQSGGTWSKTPASITGLSTFSIDSSTGKITMTGNGSTVIGATTVTVTISASGNYKAASATFKVSASYFNWPSVTDDNAENPPTGTADWWTGLQGWLKTATTAQKQKALGKKVKVTLSAAVLGTTTHYVRCIGYDCDGANTLTFETMNTLAEYTAFSASSALWVDGSTDSTARAKCKEYYNAFPGKNAIRSVNKRYCSVQNGSMTNSADKTYEETCFLVSICERGYSQANGYASSQEEFAVENTSKTPYQYFTGNDRRGKYKGTDTDPEGKTSGLTGYPWTRSRVYDNANNVCRVGYDGIATGSGYYGSTGLAPAFAIKPAA